MKIALDMQLAVGTATGIGEYARGLARALRDDGADIVELCEPALDPWRFDRRVVWDQVLLPQRVRASHAQLLHCTSGTMPMHLSVPAVVTVHDVAWLKVQQHTRPYARYYFGRFALQRYRSAAAIAVDSAFSKRELLEAFEIDPARVRVVYPGVAADFASVERAAASEPFVLVPGTVERRKNIEVLIRAIASIDDVRIVSVGPHTRYQDECIALAQDLSVSDRVEFRGYVPREELLALYASCAMVAVPSTYEGFGYAAAQALCAGAPAAVANCASLPEVVSSSAPLLDPHDERAWAQAIASVIAGPQAAQLRASGERANAIARFSWSTAAAVMRDIYGRALIHG